MTSELTYRVYEDKDLPSVLKLWEEHSGWGAITEEQFAKWYLNTPNGRCLIIVATDDGDEIAGQMVFIPTRLTVNSKEVKAYRGSAPILHPHCRQININNSNHPAFAMIKKGIEEGKRRGYQLTYSFPAQGWATLLKAFPRYGLPHMNVALFDCFSIDVEAYNNVQSNLTFTAILNQPFNNEYDELWENACTQFPIACGVSRNAKWLEWKLGGHLVFECRQLAGNNLLGYVAINKKSGLIVDMLAETPEQLNQVLHAVLAFLKQDKSNTMVAKNITGMLTPATIAALKNIDYKKENYTFGFGCYLFESSPLAHETEISNWYMMPND